MNWDRLGVQVDVVVVSNEIVAKPVNWQLLDSLKPNLVLQIVK